MTARPDVLPVAVDGVGLALRAERVLEVLGPQLWVRIPAASRLVPGVLAWRARTVAVVDLAAAIPDVPPLTPEPRRRVVIARSAEGTLAIPVDVAWEVRAVDADSIRTAQATRGANLEASLNGRWMPLLDLDAIAATVTGAQGSS